MQQHVVVEKPVVPTTSIRVYSPQSIPFLLHLNLPLPQVEKHFKNEAMIISAGLAGARSDVSDVDFTDILTHL